jgi:hypothetical protein
MARGMPFGARGTVSPISEFLVHRGHTIISRQGGRDPPR